MNEYSISELLRLYEEGLATEEQRKIVEAYLAYHQKQSPKREPGKDQGEDRLQVMMEKIRLAREEEARQAAPYSIDGAEVGRGEEDGETAAAPALGRGRQVRVFWVAAASVMLIITTGLLWWNAANKPAPVPEAVAVTYKTVRAAPGKMVHLLFSDSSEVWLNAGAVLRYPQPFDDKMRKLELLDGEAFFQVHQDAKRGFVVESGSLQTKVLGTSFNIKAYRESQQMSVSVTSGKVSVMAGTGMSGQVMTLVHDQEARFNTATGRVTRNVPAFGKDRDWKDGSFNFVDESLGDIAIELEHYFNVHIGFKYPGIKKYNISASFRHTASLKDMLGTLCQLNQNHFIQIDDQHYVII